MSGKIIYLDRSRISERRTCGQKRYLKYHALGHGLEVAGPTSLPLIHGNIFHSLAEQYFKDFKNKAANIVPFVPKLYIDQLEEHAKNAHQDFRSLNLWNAACVFAAAKEELFPKLFTSEYEILDVEREFEWEIAPGMKLMMRMDLILRNKLTNTIKIIDWKTTGSSFGYDWGDRFKNSLQTLIYPRAAEEHYGLDCEGIQYVGIFVGKVAKFNDTNKEYPHLNGEMVIHSPYTVVYALNGLNGMPNKLLFFSTKYKTGWTRKYVPLYDYMVEDYVAALAPSQIMETFELGTSFLPTTEQMERVRRQVAWNETLFAAMVEEVNAISDPTQRQLLADLYFEKNDEACFAYNRQCEFTDMCFGNFTAVNPLANGFKQRTPHHKKEFELLNAATPYIVDDDIPF